MQRGTTPIARGVCEKGLHPIAIYDRLSVTSVSLKGCDGCVQYLWVCTVSVDIVMATYGHHNTGNIWSDLKLRMLSYCKVHSVVCNLWTCLT